METDAVKSNQESLLLTPLSPTRVTLRLAALYGGLGIAWILSSDHILSSLVADPASLTRYQTLKGVVYVFVTAIIFCLVLRHELMKRQAAQKELLESNEKFRQLADNINSVLWIANPEKSRMIYVSPGYERIWGRSADGLYRSAVAWIDAIVPEDRDRIRQSAANKQDSGLYDEEYRIERPDGSIRWIRDRAYPARNPAGKIYWIVGVADDITEKKKVQEELESANRIKSDFLNVMSHELRTPLNIIAGYVELLREGVLGDIEVRQVEALEKVTRQAHELLIMVNGILDVTRIEGGAVHVELKEVDLNAFIQELKSDYALPMGKPVKFIWQCPAALPVIYSDGAKLRSIVQNLMNNALKFTEIGAITVACRHSADAGTFEFQVEDTGIGIPQDKLPHVFDLFWQADSSEKRIHGGVGLGLYIVKKYTDLLGGRISVKSEPGKGTQITICIPDGLSHQRGIPA
jgi:PAS domain S-box-containing protein